MADTKPTIKVGHKGPFIIKGGATLVYSAGSEGGNGCPAPLWTLHQETFL